MIAFLWGLTMFFMMIYWHGAGEQNLSNEAYKTTPVKFAAKAQAMIDEYTVRQEGGVPGRAPSARQRRLPDRPIVAMVADTRTRERPELPAAPLLDGLAARLFAAAGQHQHPGTPGYDMVVTVKPDQAGEYGVVCNEFCGIGHHNMVGKIYVVE